MTDTNCSCLRTYFTHSVCRTHENNNAPILVIPQRTGAAALLFVRTCVAPSCCSAYRLSAHFIDSNKCVSYLWLHVQDKFRLKYFCLKYFQWRHHVGACLHSALMTVPRNRTHFMETFVKNVKANALLVFPNQANCRSATHANRPPPPTPLINRTQRFITVFTTARLQSLFGVG